MAYVLTAGTFTVTNITLTRTGDLSNRLWINRYDNYLDLTRTGYSYLEFQRAMATASEVANLLGTLIYDVQEGGYDGSNYTITSGTTDRTFDANSTSFTELLDVISTIVADESSFVFEPSGYTITNDTEDWILDCTSTSLNELADVLATVLQNAGIMPHGSIRMGSIRLYQYFVIDIDESQICGGSVSRAKNINLADGEVTDQTFKVGPTTAVKIWDKTENEAMGNFDFLWLESDLDVLVQFTTDAAGTDAYDLKKLKGSGKAGEMGPAMVLGSDDTQVLDGSIDAFDGTADTVDEIWVYNEHATDTARVRMVVAT